MGTNSGGRCTKLPGQKTIVISMILAVVVVRVVVVMRIAQ
jgi:hypothetical protein